MEFFMLQPISGRLVRSLCPDLTENVTENLFLSFFGAYSMAKVPLPVRFFHAFSFRLRYKDLMKMLSAPDDVWRFYVHLYPLGEAVQEHNSNTKIRIS